MKTKNQWNASLASLLAVTGVLSASGSHAQVGTSGGGDVVVCMDAAGKIINMEAYDFWNASKKFTLTVPLDSTTPYMDQVRSRFERLGKIDPVASEYYLNEMKRFAPDEIGKPDAQVSLVPNLANNGDGKHVTLPEGTAPGCYRSEIRRMASFNPKPLPFEKPFLIMESLWKQAPEHVKAAIVQHELIYRVAKTVFTETDSVNSQFFNALISSNQFLSLTEIQYQEILSKLDWTRRPFYSIAFAGETFMSLYFGLRSNGLNDPVTGGFLAKPSNLLINGQRIQSRSEMYFYRNGVLALFRGEHVLMDLPGFQSKTRVSVCLFSESGAVVKCNMTGYQDVTFENQNLKLSGYGGIRFHPNGDLECMTIQGGPRFFTYKGQTLRLIKRETEYTISFDPKTNALRVGATCLGI